MCLCTNYGLQGTIVHAGLSTVILLLEILVADCPICAVDVTILPLISRTHVMASLICDSGNIKY